MLYWSGFGCWWSPRPSSGGSYGTTFKPRKRRRNFFGKPRDITPIVRRMTPKKADEQLRQAIAEYREVVEQYPRTPSGPLALFHLGNAQILANETDAGIESYKRFMLLYGSNPALLGLVQQRLGYAYLTKNDRDQAVKAFSAVLDIPGALNKDNVLFELAKLEEAQSRPEGALAHYQDLMKNHPNSPFASEAAVRVKVLETKNAVPDSVVPAPASAPDPRRQRSRLKSRQAEFKKEITLFSRLTRGWSRSTGR